MGGAVEGGSGSELGVGGFGSGGSGTGPGGDLEFMGLRERSEYTHHPGGEGPVREVEGSAVPAELSGHLSREGAPTGIVISRSEHEENERRSARIEAELDKLLGVAPESEDGIQSGEGCPS